MARASALIRSTYCRFRNFKPKKAARDFRGRLFCWFPIGCHAKFWQKRDFFLVVFGVVSIADGVAASAATRLRNARGNRQSVRRDKANEA